MARFKRIGALWSRTSKSGIKFLSGYLDRGIDGDIPIAVFKVQEKSSEKGPDFIIALVPPHSRQQASAGTHDPDTDDDIPLP